MIKAVTEFEYWRSRKRKEGTEVEKVFYAVNNYFHELRYKYISMVMTGFSRCDRGQRNSTEALNIPKIIYDTLGSPTHVPCRVRE